MWNIRKNRVLIALLAVLALIVFIIISGRTINVRRYTVETPSLDEGKSVKIVHISDLHSTVYGEGQATLVKKIEEQEPNLILMSGDILDEDNPHEGTELLLSKISGLAPIYYVSGNHEYWDDIHEIRRILRSYGVVVLSDSYVRLGVNGSNLVVAGADDPEKWMEEPLYDQPSSMEKAFRELDDVDAYKILIAHRPENIEEYQKFSFDLVLSGHAHGGQVRIPFVLNGLYAPNQGFFPKYAGGLYWHGGMAHVVSRGMSVNLLLPRVFNPPELVVITLNGTKANGE